LYRKITENGLNNYKKSRFALLLQLTIYRLLIYIVHMSKRVTGLLPQVTFSILFALSLKPRHGYELMQQIEQDSAGRVKLGPGALYGSIKQLVEDNFIEEMPFSGDTRRRYYRLTKKGWDQLSSELKYFENTVKLAQQRKAFGQGEVSIWAS
jgi:DNA-binding PadR family transcriptional regulator